MLRISLFKAFLWHEVVLLLESIEILGAWGRDVLHNWWNWRFTLTLILETWLIARFDQCFNQMTFVASLVIISFQGQCMGFRLARFIELGYDLDLMDAFGIFNSDFFLFKRRMSPICLEIMLLPLSLRSVLGDQSSCFTHGWDYLCGVLLTIWIERAFRDFFTFDLSRHKPWEGIDINLTRLVGVKVIINHALAHSTGILGSIWVTKHHISKNAICLLLAIPISKCLGLLVYSLIVSFGNRT